MNATEQLLLYSYFRSSASYRVRIALFLKKMPFKYMPVHLLKDGGEQFSVEYKQLNPLAQVPCLIHNNVPISQSMAIIQYLDDICPDPLLWPRTPTHRAVVTQICEAINSGIQPLQNLSLLGKLTSEFHSTPEQNAKWIQHWNQIGLTAIESLLKKTSGQFCVGDKVTAADCFLIPQVFSAKRFGVDLSAYPNILKINENALALEEFQAASPERQPDYVS